MKRLIQFKKGCFAILALMICAVASLTACDRFNGPSFSGDGPDSVYIAEYVEAVTNPTFETVDEVIMFQSRFVEEASIDDTFRTIPEEVLTNVATICLKKYPNVTKKDIVIEYKTNRGIYDNLPNNTHEDKDKATATEEQQKPVADVSYRYELDTVDGKPVRTLVKEERTHEK